MRQLGLVTIVVPVYNGEEFLHENIKSILGQTYANLEIIYVCAGCIDSSVNILQKYMKSDSRLKLHIEEENHGPASSRNIGMAMAKGEWIIFLDSDDLFEHDMIKVMLEKATEEKADMCCCYWDCFDDNLSTKIYTTSETIKLYSETYPNINVSNEKRHLFQLIEYNVWTKLIHRTIYEKEGVNFSNFLNCEDFYFSLIAATEARRIVYVDQILVHYRRMIKRNTQTTLMHNRSCMWDVLDRVFQYICIKEDNEKLKQSFYNCVCKCIYNARNSVTSEYKRLFDELQNKYVEQWKMMDNDIYSKLSYFNQEVFNRVSNGSYVLDGEEMRVQAKVHFIKNIARKEGCSLWGCGVQGQKILKRLSIDGIEIQHIFDSDSKKWGLDLFGKRVEQFTDNQVDNVIVTSSRYYNEIKNQIGSYADKVYNLEKEILI